MKVSEMIEDCENRWGINFAPEVVELYSGCKTSEIENPTWHLLTAKAGEPNNRICELPTVANLKFKVTKKMVSYITCKKCLEVYENAQR